MTSQAIQVKNVTKSFKLNKPSGIFSLAKKKLNGKHNKTFKALDEISLTVQRGEVLGIIGLNGSGKTTLLRIIAGIYKPDKGSVMVNGRMSSLLHLGTGFQGELNAEENIVMNGLLLGVSKSYIKSQVENIIRYAELEKFSNLKLKHYSSGMRARLAFTTAMEINPDILLVDEILAVGDINFREKSYEKFLQFKKDNKTVLHASHNLDKMETISDRVLFLHKGKIEMIGEPKEIIKSYKQMKNKNNL